MQLNFTLTGGNIMKKALIICAAGMSSSLIAKKTTDFFAEKNLPIHVDATTVPTAPEAIERNDFDLYLLSPQARLNYDKLSGKVEAHDKKLINIPPTAYVPTEKGITEIAKIVFTEFKADLQKQKG